MCVSPVAVSYFSEIADYGVDWRALSEGHRFLLLDKKVCSERLHLQQHNQAAQHSTKTAAAAPSPEMHSCCAYVTGTMLALVRGVAE